MDTNPRDVVPHDPLVSDSQRRALMRQSGFVVWLTGLSGAGKSTLAYALEARLIEVGHATCVLDGDNLRRGLCADLGFSGTDRRENCRRAACVAGLLADAGLIVVTSLISPTRSVRAEARDTVGRDRFLETFVDAPIDICEARDPKGLYRRARAGEIADFTGVSSPYEAPASPDLHLRTDTNSIESLVDRVVTELHARDVLIGCSP